MAEVTAQLPHGQAHVPQDWLVAEMALVRRCWLLVDTMHLERIAKVQISHTRTYGTSITAEYLDTHPACIKTALVPMTGRADILQQAKQARDQP